MTRYIHCVCFATYCVLTQKVCFAKLFPKLHKMNLLQMLHCNRAHVVVSIVLVLRQVLQNLGYFAPCHVTRTFSMCMP